MYFSLIAFLLEKGEMTIDTDTKDKESNESASEFRSALDCLEGVVSEEKTNSDPRKRLESSFSHSIQVSRPHMKLLLPLLVLITLLPFLAFASAFSAFDFPSFHRLDIGFPLSTFLSLLPSQTKTKCVLPLSKLFPFLQDPFQLRSSKLFRIWRGC